MYTYRLLSLALIFLSSCCHTTLAPEEILYSVQLDKQQVDVYKAGKKIKTMPCSTAIKKGDTPKGIFKTYAKKDKGIWKGKDGDAITYYFITKFHNDVGFHSQIEGEHKLVKIGHALFAARKPSSKGCVRLKKEDAKWVYDQPLGSIVEVVDTK